MVWTEANAPAGTYTLKFKLVDMSGGGSPMLESGIVTSLYRVQGEPQLSIAKTVTLSMPVVTEGCTLEEATSTEGPWTPVTATPVVETLTGGHSAAQTGKKLLTQPGDLATKFYRLRKLRERVRKRASGWHRLPACPVGLPARRNGSSR